MKAILTVFMLTVFLGGCVHHHHTPPGHDKNGPGNSENAPGHNKHGHDDKKKKTVNQHAML